MSDGIQVADNGIQVHTNGIVIGASGDPCCCITCTPKVIAAKVTNGASPDFNLAPYQSDHVADGGQYWRLCEVGITGFGSYTYLIGCVDANGKLTNLPSNFHSQYQYDGYMELQVGCRSSTDPTTTINYPHNRFASIYPCP